jgi:alkylhydroperoxidase family enzyme
MDIQALDAQWGQSWLQPSPVPDDLAAAARKAFGGDLPGWVALIAPVPWAVRVMLGGIDKKVAHMPIDLWDLISFVVSQDNACRYCYGTTRVTLRVLGYSDAVIDRLEGDVDLAAIPEAEQAALRFARTLSRFHPPPDANDFAELEAAGFSAPAIAEIVYISSAAGFGNRVATFFALQPESFENMMKSPLVRLIRPWLARQFRGRHVPATTLPAPNEPPFEDLIARLDGSPTAYSMRRAVDESLASPILPRRTKLLMFAIIARTLGSAYVGAQTRRALVAEGMDAESLDAVLQNLGGPGLTAAESLLVPYARETVWYRNLDVQERTRALAASFSSEEVIEAVATASLANAVSRGSVLVDR